ncbi:hypothetical protein LPTSP3_g32410 [Leptospira kobayashii]|uniref:DinB family protein n=1 Tax=Leptospira kobayashii TaxID=1917830 RepID=A0ABM7UML3_9LEPT|nr:hypothetical protein [Leptospira kobayashii]BDA80311.1 hypothetical protein LPTSP3_g32410 [Leptospira kobayashii]
MKINHQIISQLRTLNTILGELKEEEFIEKDSLLCGSSIGQHVRHTLEFIECLMNSKEGEFFSYDDRKRNPTLESSLTFAREVLEKTELDLADYIPPRKIRLKHILNETDSFITETNGERELLFVLDHMIHHMALIRIAMENKFHWILLPADFGYTPSTLIARSIPS